jgi:hypothetical protein
MTYRVLYTSSYQDHAIIHTTEWICPADYNRDRARQSFEQQFPSATVIQLCLWQFSERCFGH